MHSSAVAVGAAGTAGASTLTGGGVAAAILGGRDGRHHLGTIQGVTITCAACGQALGPVTAGFVFDVTGTYHQVFLGFAGVVLLGSVCVLPATPPGSSKDCSA
jgi:MFS family permease